MNNKKFYPIIHFAPKFGWLNDPNGLVFHDGIYELYFQHNPEGIEWGNMTWGHARSSDLLHWEELEPVLRPDENGFMYSGCGIRNDRGVLGLPEDALFFSIRQRCITGWMRQKHDLQFVWLIHWMVVIHW